MPNLLHVGDFGGERIYSHPDGSYYVIKEGTPIPIPSVISKAIIEHPLWIRPNVQYPIGKYPNGLPYSI